MRYHRKFLRFERVTAALVLAGLGLATASCASGDAHRSSPRSPVHDAPPAVAPTVREAWRWPVPPRGSAGMPTVSSDPAQHIAFTYGHIALVLLDAHGATLWETRRVGLREVAPTITAGSVLAATDEGVAAFDRTDGRLLWDTHIGERANAPVVIDEVAAVTTWDASLLGIRVDDGSVAWRKLLPGAALGPAAVGPSPHDTSARAIVVATWDTGLRAGATAVSALDGGALWDVSLEPGGVSGPGFVSGSGPGQPSTVVVVAGDLAAHGLSDADGVERWRAPLEGSGEPEVMPSPLPDGGVMVGHRLGGFAVLDHLGALRWKASSDGVALRGGPVAWGDTAARGDTASTGDTAFGDTVAMALDDERVLLGNSGAVTTVHPGVGRVSGLAAMDDGTLLVGTRGPQPAALIAFTDRAGP